MKRRNRRTLLGTLLGTLGTLPLAGHYNTEE